MDNFIIYFQQKINLKNKKMSIIESLEKNRFIDDLRQNLIFNEEEYASLLKILNTIKEQFKDKDLIEKRIAAYLYEIPKMVFIWKENLKADPNYSNITFIDQLEDAFLELDAIIAEEILWSN